MRSFEATVQQPIIEGMKFGGYTFPWHESSRRGFHNSKKKRNGDLIHLEREFVRCFGIKMMKAGKVVNMNELFKISFKKIMKFRISP